MLRKAESKNERRIPFPFSVFLLSDKKQTFINLKIKQTMKHSPKLDAVRDIKEELKNESRCFIAFRSYLNPVMKELVKQHVKEQKKITHEK